MGLRSSRDYERSTFGQIALYGSSLKTELYPKPRSFSSREGEIICSPLYFSRARPENSVFQKP